VADGASVVLADIDIDTAERTAASLVDAGGQAIAVDCDVADPERVDAAAATAVDRFCGVDIVINHAGLHLTKYSQPFGVLSRNEIRDLFDVNVMGVINVKLACRDSMHSRGGGVVLNISSMAGYMSATPSAPGLMNTEKALADPPQPLIDEFTYRLQLVRASAR
jgi:NAD(P)-dependent dehydrogenase (short-subunit alcohol dehydrogenase family)